MDVHEFRKRAHEVADIMADYYEGIESYPVKSRAQPGEILAKLPDDPPAGPEPFESIIRDWNEILMPGITHWQHPSFFAYFNANASFPSILAEMLTAATGAQCMIWQTSPAAAELEERVMRWLRDMIGLPAAFTGVIQDSASTATLCALISARERKSSYAVNESGCYGRKPFTVYCSGEAHSSIEKDVKIAGLGREYLRKIQVDASFAMRPDALEKAIQNDIAAGCVPLAVVAAIGTTGSSAIDPLESIGTICERYGVWLHVDAAYAGTALVLSDMRWMTRGIERVDSFVFNPHKWMFTNFDCTAYFVQDVGALVRAFEILPEYLRTSEGSSVNNYRDWGIQLGRRFRALKLWFVIRSFGVEGIRGAIANHLAWATELVDAIKSCDDFELLAPAPLSLVCFRYHPRGMDLPDNLNRINEALLEKLNATGKLYLTHTKLSGAYTLRMVVGQTYQQRHHVRDAWTYIQETARNMSGF